MNDNNTQDRYTAERLGFETSLPLNGEQENSSGGSRSIDRLSNESKTGQAEYMLSNPELVKNSSQQNLTQHQNGMTPQDIQTTSQSSVSTAQQSSTTIATASTADDVDLIEKEWVEKAKSIVAKTFNDPYLQNKAFGNLRSEYMKKRFGKTIKTED